MKGTDDGKGLYPAHLKWEGREGEVYLETERNGHRYQMRLNECPAEPLYTLYVEGREVLSSDHLPDTWTIDWASVGRS